MISVNYGFGGSVMTVTNAKSSAESEKFTFKIRSESGKLFIIGCHFPPKSTNFGTLPQGVQSGCGTVGRRWPTWPCPTGPWSQWSRFWEMIYVVLWGRLVTSVSQTPIRSTQKDSQPSWESQLFFGRSCSSASYSPSGPWVGSAPFALLSALLSAGIRDFTRYGKTFDAPFDSDAARWDWS